MTLKAVDAVATREMDQADLASSHGGPIAARTDADHHLCRNGRCSAWSCPLPARSFLALEKFQHRHIDSRPQPPNIIKI